MTYSNDNYLGKAAEAKHKAKAAIKARRFSAAWKLLEKEKEYYARHAARMGFTPQQTTALDACVHEYFADILRLKGQHKEALVHVVYWVLSHRDTRPTKIQQNKFKAYLGRCKFRITLEDANVDVKYEGGHPNLETSRALVDQWDR